jgi:hypothetical protein
MLRYRRWISKSASWSAEQWPSGIRIHAAGGYGSEHPDPDPDNDVDSKAPHVLAGSEYARWDGTQWQRGRPRVRSLRDTELAMALNIVKISGAG